MARDITPANGITYTVRGLTRAELKQLRKEGLHPTCLNNDNVDEGVDRALGMMLTEEQIAGIDKMENQESMKVWRAVLAETFGSQAEEKN
jgi:hypothetical protein